jgi:hypothetical protein
MVHTKPISEGNDYWVNTKMNNATYNNWYDTFPTWKIYEHIIISAIQAKYQRKTNLPENFWIL